MRHDAITSALLPARSQILRVNESAQPDQSRHRDARTAFHDHFAAMDLIEHPARDENPKVLLALHDDSRIGIHPESANYLNFAAKNWMESICDPCQTELMSSVLMR